MESIEYEFRDIESVPMKNESDSSYDICLDGELVNMPEDLFHKIFREKTLISIFGLQKDSWPGVLQQSYDDMRLGIRMWINGGKNLEQIKKMASSYYDDMPKPVLDVMNAVIEKLYEEEIKNKEKD
jgi:hypothetical protein